VRARAMILFVSLLMIMLSVSAIVMFLYWQSHVMATKGTAMKILAAALGPIALAVCNVCIFATQPILAITYERNPTWTTFERNVTLRLFLFQILNASLTVLIFVYMDLDFHVRCWPKVDIANPVKIADTLSQIVRRNVTHADPRDGQCSFDQFWFSTGGVTVINGMIGDITFISIVLEWVRPDKMIQRYWLAKRARSQHEANVMYEGPDFMIAFRYQLILKFIFMGLMFSTAIPVSSFVVAIFLAESYLIDKYNLCRQAWLSPLTWALLLPTPHQFSPKGIARGTALLRFCSTNRRRILTRNCWSSSCSRLCLSLSCCTLLWGASFWSALPCYAALVA